MIAAGEFSLWIALLMAVWGSLLSLAGGALRRADFVASGERGLVASFGFVLAAAAGFWAALWSTDLSLRYVASFTSTSLAGLYRLSAFWAAPAGSLLFGALALAASTALVLFVNRCRHVELMPWVAGTLGALLACSVASSVIGANPFERLAFPPTEGRGLAPQLQNAAMALHPPLLLLGQVMLAVPFAFGVAGLVSRELGAGWLGAVRRWTLLAWSVLTAGVVLGMWWAYREASWGKAWSWDPLEVVTVLPWIGGALLLHAVRRGVKGGVSRATAVGLTWLTFLLSALALFVTRAGVVPTRHPSAYSVGGSWFAMLSIGGALGVMLLMVARRGELAAAAPVEEAHDEGNHVLRRAGGWAAHAGAIALAFSLAAMPFEARFDVALGDGETFRATDPWGRAWAFTSQGASRRERENYSAVSVALLPTRNGARQRFIIGEQRQLFDGGQSGQAEPFSRAGVQSGALEDVYVVLADLSGEKPKLSIAFRPLASWMWVGGVMMVLGTLLALAVDAWRPGTAE